MMQFLYDHKPSYQAAVINGGYMSLNSEFTANDTTSGRFG
jgi:hypothetical protein